MKLLRKARFALSDFFYLKGIRLQRKRKKILAEIFFNIGDALYIDPENL